MSEYWDVLGDGWNPGHTMTPEEIDWENRTLGCFRPGYYDRERGIWWRYTHKPEHRAEMDKMKIGERLVLLATQGIDECHVYEVEPNE